MSQQIDNQIVKMQFDNSSFEKNVQTSMSTLDKLKQALKFEKVDMTPLQQAFSETENTASKAGFHIQDVWLKMSSIIEEQVAQKIIDTGKKIFNALTLEGVADGFSEYELKMGSIQTIMAGTGESLATVNRYLDELNKYSDQTIYSFSDMTQNIGKFTNAGVKLEDAVAAIKGIANEAAISGANANEASRAMYNFAQALSSGYVKLIDWKSIENANMATKGFKEALLEVGTAVGTVSKRADGMYNILTENNKGKMMGDAVSGTKNFNDSLQYQWMTTEVLTNTLKLYATDVRSLTEAQKEAYETELRKLGLDEEQIKRFEELGSKATDAASEIKTFSMLMDTLKEAIGSGWAMTWQILIGDFEQAKALWTEVGSVIGGVIDDMSDARNNFLTEGLTTGWEKFISIEGKVIPQSERYRDVLVDLAKDHGILSKEQADNIDSTNSLIDSFHELNWVTGDLLMESIEDYYNTLKSMSSEELDEFGVSTMELAQLEDLNKSLKDGSINADEFAESMTKLGGRENILEGLKNIFHSVMDTLKPIGEAFDAVFEPLNPQNLYDLTERFKKFTEEMKVSEDAANTIRTAFTLAFGGIKTVIDGVVTTFKGFSKLVLPVFNLFDAIFGLIGKIVSALTGSKGALDAADKFTKIGDKIADKYLWAMQKLADFINKVADAIRGIPESTVFTKIHDGVESAITALHEFWNEFTQLPIIQQMVSDFWDTVEKIQDTITPVFESVQKAISSTMDTVQSKMNLNTLNNVLTVVYNRIKSFISIIKDVAGRIKNFFEDLRSGKSIVESFKENFGDIIEKLKELKQNAEDFFKSLFEKGDELGGKFNLEDIANAIHDFVANITPEQITMLAIAGTFTLIALNMLRLSEALKNAIDSFTGIGTALKNVINSYVKKQKSTILQIAESIVIVAAALWMLSTIPKEKLDAALGAMITLTGCLLALTVALTAAGILMNKLGGQKSMVELASGLALVAGSFFMVAGTLKLLEYVDLKGIVGKIITVSAIMVGLVGLSVLMSKLDKFNKGSLTLVAVAGAFLLASTALAEIGKIPSDRLDKSVDVMLKMMLGLAAVTFAAGKVGVFSAVGILAVVMMLDKLLPTIEHIVNYDYTTMETGIERNKNVLLKLGGLVLIMTAIGALAGNRIKGAAIAMLSISATFAILLGIAKLASMMKPQELDKGEKFLWHMAGIIALLELCSARSQIGMWGGKNGGEGSKMFTRIAFAMGMLLGIAKLASMMSVADLVKGELAVLGLVGIVTAMALVGRVAGKSEGMIKTVTGMIFAISLVLAEVALLSIIPMDNMVPALLSVLGIIGALAALALAISKNTKIYDKATQKSVSGMLGLIVAILGIAAIGAIMYQLAKEPVANVAAAAGAMVGIIAALTVFARALSKISGDKISIGQVQAFIGSAIMLTIIAGVLAALTTYMKKYSIQPKTMVDAAKSIAIVIAGLIPVMFLLSRFKTGVIDYKAVGEAVIGAILVLASVATAIGLLSNLGNPAALLDSAISIAIGLVAISVPLAVLGAVGKYCQSIKLGPMATVVISAIGLLAGVTGALWALSNYGNPQTMIQSAQALAVALVAISIPIAVLGAVGELCRNAKIGVMITSVAGAIVAMAAICYILYQFSNNMDLQAIERLNAAIPVLITAMAGVSLMALAISTAGLLSGPGGVGAVLAGGLAMVEAIVIFGLIIAAIAGLGAALNRINGLEGALTKGLDFLVVIAGKLGEAAGALIGGFGVGITDQLDPIADNLNSFSEKMITFSENMSKVNKDAVDGCKTIAEAILLLGAADFISAITNWLNVFGLGFDKDLSFKEIGEAMSEFCLAVKDVPEEAVSKAAQCSVIAKRLAEVSSSLDAKGGLAGLIFGDKESLKDFAEGVGTFGEGIIAFCESVQGIPDNAAELVQKAHDAAIPMVELTSNLVAHGGIIQAIAGEKDLGLFGENLTIFISALTQFIGALTVLEGFNPNYPDLIQRCADATTPLIDLAHGIQNSGGILAEIIGDNTLDIFGETLGTFGTSLRRFVLVIDGIEKQVPNYPYQMLKCKIAVQYLIELANSLQNMGGLAAGFAGDNTLDRFGNTLESFGMSISTYVGTIAEVDGEKIMALNTPVQSLITLASSAATVSADAFYGFNMAMADLVTAVNTLSALDPVLTGTLVTDAITKLLDDILAVVNNRKSNDQAQYSLYGHAIINGIIEGINTNWPILSARIDTMIKAIFTLLNNGLPRNAFEKYGQNIVLGIRDGITYNWPTLETRVLKLISDIKAKFDSTSAPKGLIVSEFEKYGKAIIDGIKKGIDDNWDKGTNLKKRIEDLIQDIKDILDDGMSSDKFEKYGENITEGMSDGIDNNSSKSTKSARLMAVDVNNAVTDEFDINSPSKVAYGFGKFYDLGLANAIRDYASKAVSSTEGMAEDVVKAANNVISAIRFALDSNIDAEPTIRPVLDTSDIVEKADKISKLFDSTDLQLAYKASGAINQISDEKAQQRINSNTYNGDKDQVAPNQINFTQNNYSPKALSRVEIYRDTKNQLSMMKGVVMAHG